MLETVSNLEQDLGEAFGNGSPVIETEMFHAIKSPSRLITPGSDGSFDVVAQFLHLFDFSQGIGTEVEYQKLEVPFADNV